MQAALGAPDDVRRFVQRAMARLAAPLEPAPRGAFRAPLGALPAALKERLEGDALSGTLTIDFNQPPAGRAKFVHRSHPLVGALADTLLERALVGDAGGVTDALGLLGRAGAWRTAAVDTQVTVLMLRLRHQITATVGATRSRAGRTSVLLVEEGVPVALVGRQSPRVVTGDEVSAWLAAPVTGDLAPAARTRVLDEVLAALPSHRPVLEALAAGQAEALLADHRRVREAARATGRYDVTALLPVDVVATYVLLPAT
jgi:hypothetical protein